MMSEPGQMGLLPEFDQPLAESLSQEQQYAEYMRSPAWRQLRQQALKVAGHRCQKCGVSKWSAILEVHHLTYERFKQENLSDLIVLCENCHKDADAERRQQVEGRNTRAFEDARLEGWARKVYGDEWRDSTDPDMVSEQYAEWRERKAAEW